MYYKHAYSLLFVKYSCSCIKCNTGEGLKQKCSTRKSKKEKKEIKIERKDERKKERKEGERKEGRNKQ